MGMEASTRRGRTGLIFAALFWLSIAVVAATETDFDNDRRNKR